MTNIGFYSNQLGARGTEVAMFDYAYYNQIMFNNKSFIFYYKNSENNNEEVIKKFTKEFTVIPLDNFSEIDKYILENNISILYNIKYGIHDGLLSKVAKNVIHCVFHCGQPHGEVYSSISKNVIDYNNNVPIIPHMVNLPYHEENMRKELNIPEDATVFGRHGGLHQFDIRYVKDVVYNIAKSNPNIYFLFVNTYNFCEKLNNIIHLNTIIDLNIKRKFINTCDAMLWARSDGETFGLSIAEFSICNKPVIATNVGSDAHYHLLQDKGLWYSNSSELINIIETISSTDKNELKKKDWNAYTEYLPENVMKIFYKYAIEPFTNSLSPS